MDAGIMVQQKLIILEASEKIKNIPSSRIDRPQLCPGHRVTLRSDAPKGKESGSVREEFQIVGNKSC